jgi:hypothetical protein
VSNRLTGVDKARVSAGLYGFQENIQVCFHAGQKYYIRKIVYITLTRKGTTLCGSCCSALFGIKFRTGAFPTLRPWMASSTSARLVKAGSHSSMLATPLQSSQWLSDSMGRLPLELRLKTVSTIFGFLGVPESHYLSGKKGWWWKTKCHCPSTHIQPDWSSGPRLSGADVHWSFLHMLRWFVTLSRDGCSFIGVFGRE